MHTYSFNIFISTQGKGTYCITEHLKQKIPLSRVENGTMTVFVKHTSCSLVIMENADPTARQDLHKFFEALVPENIPYFNHTYEGPDDMPSHVRMVLTGCSQVIPIIHGDLALGTWQGLFLFEHRHAPQRRSIAVMIMGH